MYDRTENVISTCLENPMLVTPTVVIAKWVPYNAVHSLLCSQGCPWIDVDISKGMMLPCLL